MLVWGGATRALERSRLAKRFALPTAWAS